MTIRELAYQKRRMFYMYDNRDKVMSYLDKLIDDMQKHREECSSRIKLFCKDCRVLDRRRTGIMNTIMFIAKDDDLAKRWKE